LYAGDHQQLRPSPAVYRLARDFNFDISLFERMLKNKMHCEVLKVQHRMRPEVAELIVPAIYPELLNHNSVLQYEKIHGMLNSVFFITHNHAEEEVCNILILNAVLLWVVWGL
jgi:superfamily I DNA and/or RNA helicase